VFHDFVVAVEFPTVDQDVGGLPVGDPLDEGGIDDAFVMMAARLFGGVFHKFMVVAFEQGYVPFYFFAKGAVVVIMLALTPGIEDFNGKAFLLRQLFE